MKYIDRLVRFWQSRQDRVNVSYINSSNSSHRCLFVPPSYFAKVFHLVMEMSDLIFLRQCKSCIIFVYSRKALAMPGNREDSVVRFVWGREGRRNFSLQKSKHGVSGPSFLRIQVLKTEFLVSFSLEISSLFSGYVLNLRVNWTAFSWISWIHRPKLFSATLRGNNACRNQHRCKEMTLQELQNYIPCILPSGEWGHSRKLVISYQSFHQYDSRLWSIIC